MRELVRYLLENAYIDFQGDLSMEKVREFLRDDETREARSLLAKLIDDKGVDDLLITIADCLKDHIRAGINRGDHSRAVGHLQRVLSGAIPTLRAFPRFALELRSPGHGLLARVPAISPLSGVWRVNATLSTGAPQPLRGAQAARGFRLDSPGGAARFPPPWPRCVSFPLV